jgi:hypothetical protein
MNISLVNEPGYRFGSNDNSRQYQVELDLDGEYRPSSIHGILVEGVPIVVFGASGGATAIHENSFVSNAISNFLAVGPYVVCFSLNPFTLHWAKQIDDATCFGVYFSPAIDSLICHGELSISRLNLDGIVDWTFYAEDIFTGDFSLTSDKVIVQDFNGKNYNISLKSGREIG